jgi:hypothetical protein
VPPNSAAIWATVCLRLPSAPVSSYISTPSGRVTAGNPKLDTLCNAGSVAAVKRVISCGAGRRLRVLASATIARSDAGCGAGQVAGDLGGVEDADGACDEDRNTILRRS